jgi:hypothetical protein
MINPLSSLTEGSGAKGYKEFLAGKVLDVSPSLPAAAEET